MPPEAAVVVGAVMFDMLGANALPPPNRGVPAVAPPAVAPPNRLLEAVPDVVVAAVEPKLRPVEGVVELAAAPPKRPPPEAGVVLPVPNKPPGLAAAEAVGGVPREPNKLPAVAAGLLAADPRPGAGVDELPKENEGVLLKAKEGLLLGAVVAGVDDPAVDWVPKLKDIFPVTLPMSCNRCRERTSPWAN